MRAEVAGCRGGNLSAGQEKPEGRVAYRGEYAARWFEPFVLMSGRPFWPDSVSKAWPRASALELIYLHIQHSSSLRRSSCRACFLVKTRVQWRRVSGGVVRVP